MRLPEVRNSVAFIMYRPNGTDPAAFGGTCFFVRYGPRLQPGFGLTYVVTARHVVEEAARRSHDGIVRIRVDVQPQVRDKAETLTERIRQLDGGPQPPHQLPFPPPGLKHGINEIETRLSQWSFHPDQSRYVDVAVFEYPHYHPVHHEGRLELFRWRDGAPSATERHKVGESVYMPGLFAVHPGEMRNIPVIRHGTIAALPEESIKTEMGELEGYIVELRSMGGHSGSPVLRKYVFRYDADDWDRTDYELIGVLSCSWKPSLSDYLTKVAREINYGLAVV